MEAIKDESTFQGIVEAQGYKAERNGLTDTKKIAQWDFYKHTRGAWIRIGSAFLPTNLTPAHMLKEAREIDD